MQSCTATKSTSIRRTNRIAWRRSGHLLPDHHFATCELSLIDASKKQNCGCVLRSLSACSSRASSNRLCTAGRTQLNNVRKLDLNLSSRPCTSAYQNKCFGTDVFLRIQVLVFNELQTPLEAPFDTPGIATRSDLGVNNSEASLAAVPNPPVARLERQSTSALVWLFGLS